MTEPRAHHPTSIAQLARLGMKRLQRREPFLVLVTGETGVGKTGFSAMFCDEAEGWKQGKFDPVRQVVRTAEEWAVARRNLGPYKFIVDEESIKSGSNRLRVMSTKNVDKTEDVNTKRKLLHGIVHNMPFVDDFDMKQFKHFQWRLDLGPRGYGKAYEIQRVGFHKIKVWEEPRFEFEYPNCEVVRPDLWEPINERAIRAEKGIEEAGAGERERVTRYAETAARILG